MGFFYLSEEKKSCKLNKVKITFPKETKKQEEDILKQEKDVLKQEKYVQKQIFFFLEK